MKQAKEGTERSPGSFVPLFCLMALFGFLPTPPAAAAPPDVPLAMWVWDAAAITSPPAREQLLAFCRAQRIGALYVAAHQLGPVASAAYRTFNREAHAAQVAVHALAGDPRWAMARYHQLPLAWMESVLAFNRASAPAERFDGLHTDIEPYLLSRQWAEHPAQLLGGLLDLHAAMAERLAQGEAPPRPAGQGLVGGRPVQLGVDVPFWFDDDPAYRISWRGRVLPPSHHLLELADYATVMAYRNYAEGADGVIALVRAEIQYAEQVGKRVVVGQETQPGLVPAYVTYGGASPDRLWGELQKILLAYQGRPGFGGVAFHHYESYRQLVQQADGGDQPLAP